MPNAGKSTLLSAVSAARPKIADYPFTTLYPQPGVVSVGLNKSFVMVDIPGLIAGAAEGAGLGIRFLKHVQRTRLLLHLVDILPTDGADIADNVRAINAELAEFSEELAGREQWLLFTKRDVMPEQEADAICAKALKKLKWKGKSYRISAVRRDGLDPLCRDAMAWVEAHAPPRVVESTESFAGVTEVPVELATEALMKSGKSGKSGKAAEEDGSRET
jgi:GTP-binding protein